MYGNRNRAMVVVAMMLAVALVHPAVPARAADCNLNGWDDELEVAAGSSPDCNNTGLPDECELVQLVRLASDALAPLAGGQPRTFTLISPLPSLGNVVVSANAFADLSDIGEFIQVSLDGESVGSLFTAGAGDCPTTPDEDQLIISPAQFNAAVADAEALIELLATGDVDNICLPSSYVLVTVEYVAFRDCNTNGIPDECEADCNLNQVPDECDISGGTSTDCDSNSLPDDCQPDCNTNGVADTCDLAAGVSSDCNSTGVPDECELAGGASLDCNDNSVPDECDIARADSYDCNANGVPDECELGLVDIGALVVQPPTRADSVFADADCQGCDPSSQQSAAANFDLTEAATIVAVNLWGGYFPNNNPGSANELTIILRETNGALPGEILSTQDELAAQRARTGQTILEGIDEWFLQLTLTEPVQLYPGRYFVEMFNNTQGNPDTFVWELGALASTGGVEGSAFAEETPGTHWLPAPLNELAFELVTATPGDCNNNQVPDVCDLNAGTSTDCNSNTTPDECEVDCNANHMPDDCDIAGGSSPDCDLNGIPDECDLAEGRSEDCNTNGVPDGCDIASGTASDCNGNGVPDGCDLAAGVSEDCQTNSIPDECEADTDNDGIIDDCEPPDSDEDGVVDEDDLCPDTAGGVEVDEDGCPVSEPRRGLGCGAGVVGAATVAAWGVAALCVGRSRRRSRLANRPGQTSTWPGGDRCNSSTG